MPGNSNFKHFKFFNKMTPPNNVSHDTINHTVSSVNIINKLSKPLITNYRSSSINYSHVKTTTLPPTTRLFTRLPARLPARLPTRPPMKRSLHIGINYMGSNYQLDGCINDANNVSSFIKQKYGFANNNISIITDNTSIKPTKNNILTAFTKLLQNTVPGDLLFFTYSGHGTQLSDRNNDERDKKDECLVSSDLQYITDDEIKRIINSNLKKNVTLVAILDACFSGSAFDLKYQYLDTISQTPLYINPKDSVTQGQVIMISGCTDNQTSADAYINKTYQGAMTWSFLSQLKKTPKPSWKNLITGMRSLLSSTNLYTQIPQISSGMNLNINNTCVLTL